MDNILKNRIRQVKDAFHFLKKDRQRQLVKLENLQKQKEITLHNIDVRVETINFIQSVASQQRIAVKERVEKLITDCLHQVYDESYAVEFDYGIKGNKTSVEINIVRKCTDGMIVKRGIQGIGGGVADTVSLPLKMIVLLNDNEFDNILITDEPGKHLDSNRVIKFAKFIQIISHKLNVQIIMNSHHQIMDQYADTIHKVSINDSISSVERIK